MGSGVAVGEPRRSAGLGAKWENIWSPGQTESGMGNPAAFSCAAEFLDDQSGGSEPGASSSTGIAVRTSQSG